MSEIIYLLLAIIAGYFGSPWGQGFVGKYSNKLRQTRSLYRISGMVKVGDDVEIFSPDAGGGSDSLGVWTVKKISAERFVFAQNDRYFQLTPTEVEAARIVIYSRK